MTAPAPVGWRAQQLHRLDVASAAVRERAERGDPVAVERRVQIAVLRAAVELVAARDGHR